jgi:hypothetical protein
VNGDHHEIPGRPVTEREQFDSVKPSTVADPLLSLNQPATCLNDRFDRVLPGGYHMVGRLLWGPCVVVKHFHGDGQFQITPVLCHETNHRKATTDHVSTAVMASAVSMIRSSRVRNRVLSSVWVSGSKYSVKGCGFAVYIAVICLLTSCV